MKTAIALTMMALGLAVPATAAPSAAYRVETVAEGLDRPWSLAFLPDGTMLVTERPGNLRAIRAGALDPQPIGGVPAVYARGQGGLFEVLPDPAFAENGVIYLSFSHGDRGANGTRVVKATFTGSALEGVTPIFDAVPTKDTGAHFGGRMAFLADGTLLLTLGDGFEYREKAQDLSGDLGKIVRIKTDGTAPDDNPFVGQAGARAEIYSYGHRNVQGLVVTPDGAVYAHEHGPRGGDEFNRIEPGRNYGWPVITYGRDYSGAVISPFTKRDGMEQPLHYWTPSIAPGGLTHYAGDKFPAWAGSFFVAALAAKDVRRLTLKDGAVEEETLFKDVGQRVRDVRAGPDGFLYLVTEEKDGSGGKVLRVVPAE